MIFAHPLSLTDSQLTIVREHAKLLPVQLRGRFLDDVADRLLPLDPADIDDYAVQSAATCALHRFMEVPL